MRKPSARALLKREQIAEAVTTVLSEQGVAGLTHRRVAEAASVPISATTYHYATKDDMLADASRRLLDGYLLAFGRMAERLRRGEGQDRSLDELVTRIVTNAAGRHRRTSLAWCEIILGAARSPAGHELATQWFADLERAWTAVAAAFEDEYDALAISIAIDTVVGFLFILLALGVGPEMVDAVRAGTAIEAIARTTSAEAADAKPPSSAKAERTRAAILDAAINLLVREGSGSISHRTVAAEAGVALTAPAYHFGSIDRLIQEAQGRLFDAAKQRYRELNLKLGTRPASADEVADLTAAVLVREATEFGQASLAHYSIWLEAARSAALRPEVAAAIADQAAGWQRRLAGLGESRPRDGMAFQALFIGCLVRSLACGASLHSLAAFRQQVRVALERRYSS